VAGGRGSFVIAVHSYKDFSAAMRHKLVLEISQNETRIQQVKNARAKSGTLLKLAAAQPVAPSPTPQVLRAGPNEFSNRCDIGGFGFGGGF
jgi:hypothetical protein